MKIYKYVLSCTKIYKHVLSQNVGEFSYMTKHNFINVHSLVYYISVNIPYNTKALSTLHCQSRSKFHNSKNFATGELN